MFVFHFRSGFLYQLQPLVPGGGSRNLDLSLSIPEGAGGLPGSRGFKYIGPCGCGSKRKALGTASFGLFFLLPIGLLRYPFFDPLPCGLEAFKWAQRLKELYIADWFVTSGFSCTLFSFKDHAQIICFLLEFWQLLPGDPDPPCWVGLGDRGPISNPR